MEGALPGLGLCQPCTALMPHFKHLRKGLLEAASYARGSERVLLGVLVSNSCGHGHRGPGKDGCQSP